MIEPEKIQISSFKSKKDSPVAANQTFQSQQSHGEEADHPQIHPTSVQPPATQKIENKRRIMWIAIGVSIAVVAAVLVITLPLVLMKKGEEIPMMTPQEEELVIQIKRELNEISRYQQVSRSEISMVISKEVNANKQVVYSDILFNIYDVKNGTTPGQNLYYAYAIMNNMTKENNDKSSFLGGLNLFEEVTDTEPGEGEGTDEDSSSFFPDINDSNCTFNNSGPCVTKVLSIPLAKFSFFENGTLNELYKPSTIDLYMWSTLTDAIKQFTPALSKSLYDSKVRRLDSTESLKRAYQKEGANTKLQETSINEGGIDGIEIDSSNIKMSVDTTVDEGQGKITSVSSSGESKFVTSNNTLEDLPMNEDSPLSDIDKSNGTSTLTTGFDSLSTKMETKLDLVSSSQDANITEKIKMIANTVKFTLITKDEIKENNRLRNLVSFPFKEYSGDLSTIPRELNVLRLLKLDNFLRPIELSYPIFKMNQLGIQMNLNILLSIDVQNDAVQGKAILIVSSKQLEVFTFNSKLNVKDILMKAAGIINELATKINNLGTEAFSLYETSWSADLLKSTNEIDKILRGVFDLSQRLSLFESLEYDMNDIIEKQFNTFVIKIAEVLANLEKVDTKSISDMLLALLTKDVEDFFAAEKVKIDSFDADMIGYIRGLFYKLDTLSKGTIIDMDIYIETQEAIKNTIPMYEKHIDAVFDGLINSINNVIKEGHITYKNSVGKSIDDILLTLTTNPFLKSPLYATEVNKAIGSVKNIQSIITQQADTLFALVTINRDNIATNPITKDLNDNIIYEIDNLLTALKTEGDNLLKKMENNHLNKSVQLLLTHFSEINKIENGVKGLKIDAFKTYFKAPLIWGSFSEYIKEPFKEAISSKLSQQENEFQSFIMDIKFKTASHYSEMNDYITKELDPIKKDLMQLFSLTNLSPILSDLVKAVSLSWEEATEIFEANFRLANTYIMDVITEYNKFLIIDGGNLKYFTSLFEENYRKGRTFLKDYVRNVTSLVDYSSVFLKIKNDWSDKILQMKNYPSNAFAAQLKEFPFIEAYFGELDIISQAFEEFFKPYEENIETIMASAKNTFTAYADRLILEYEDSYNGFEKDSEKIDEYCDLYRQMAETVLQCHFVNTTNNIINMENTLVLFEFTPQIKREYDVLLDKQATYINTVTASLKNIEDNHKPFYNEIGNDVTLNEILNNWEQISIAFEKENLNLVLKTQMMKSISDYITEEGKKFIDFSKKNINEMSQEYQKLFNSQINSFDYKPSEIPYRLDQIYAFAQQSFSNINVDIDEVLFKSYDYSMTYYYQLMEHQFTSSLNTFNEHFLLELSPNFIDIIKAKVTALITKIKQNYQTKYQSMLFNDNRPQNAWGTTSIKSELTDTILPQFKALIDSIKVKIEASGKPEDNSLVQSMKVEHAITNTIKGTSVIIKTGEESLDGCLEEMKPEVINKSFEQISLTSFDFLKNNLNAYNMRLFSMEGLIVKAYENELIQELQGYLSINKISFAFDTFLQNVFTFPFDTTSVLSKVIGNMRTNLGFTFNKEIARVTQLASPKKFFKRSYFVKLLDKYEADVYENVFLHLKNYLDSIYLDLQEKIYLKLQEKTASSIANIDNISAGGRYRNVPLWTTEWSVTQAIADGILKSKDGVNNYFGNVREVIKKEYEYAYTKANKITYEMKDLMRNEITWVMDNLVSQFNLSETELPIASSEAFQKGLDEDFRGLFDQAKEGIDGRNINGIIRQSIQDEPLTVEIYGTKAEFTSKVNAFILKKINEMIDRNTAIKADINYYINDQLKFQSDTSLSLLFGRSTFYSKLKDKCLDPYLKVLWNSVDSKINDMAAFALSLLSNASTIKSSMINNIQKIMDSFKADFETLIKQALNRKIANSITAYLTPSQEKEPVFFETTFTQVIKSNGLNLMTVVQEGIDVFNIRTIPTSFNTFFTAETTETQNQFKTPLEEEITAGITEELRKITLKFKAITNQFSLMEIEVVNPSTEVIFGELRGIIAQYAALISNPFSNYLFNINPEVKTLFDTLFNTFATTLIPMSDVFEKIKTDIEDKVNLKVQQTSGIDKAIESEFKRLIVDRVVVSKNKLKGTIDSIYTIITDKVKAFEQDIYRQFFGLRQNKETQLRETAEAFSISEINNALILLKNTMNNIKAFIASSTNPMTITNAFKYYQSFLATGMKTIKKPVNYMINVFNTILDRDFVDNFEATIDKGIVNIQGIVDNNNAQMVIEINEIETYFREYQYQKIDKINNELQVLIDPQLNNLMTKVLTLVRAIDENQNASATSPDVPFEVTIMNTPVVFIFKLIHHYKFGYSMAVRDLGIFLSAYVEDYTELNSKIDVKVGASTIGGRISGTVGKGKTTIGPYYKFHDFKVYLTSTAAMTSTYVDIYSYSSTPKEEEMKDCHGGIFKHCHHWTKYYTEFKEINTRVNLENSTSSSWNKLY